MHFASQGVASIGVALVLAAGVAHADDSGCIVRSAWPEPVCAAPETPREAARVQFQHAREGLEKGDWQAACDTLLKALPHIDHDGELDVRVRSRVAIGECQQRAGKMTEAVSVWEQAISLWNSPAAAAWLRGPQDSLLSPAEVLEDVGRAEILLADQHRAMTVDVLVFPEYRYPATAYSSKRFEDMSQDEFAREVERRKAESAYVKRLIDTRIKQWVETKQLAISRAVAAYHRILEIAPRPPASALIAGNERVGAMWADFLSDFRRAPIPVWMKKDDELRGTYYCGGDYASEPIKQLAKAYFSKCLDLSVHNRLFTEDSQKCEDWLARNYKSEFHRLEEFHAEQLLDAPWHRAIPPQPARLITPPHRIAH